MTTLCCQSRRLHHLLKTCFQSLSHVRSLSPTWRFKNLSGLRIGKIGKVCSSGVLKVRRMKADPCQVSPSDATETIQSFVLSCNALTPLRTVSMIFACSSPDSHLQSPNTRTGQPGYIQLSLHKIPRAPTVA
jgi:hypothetical protein